MINYVYLILIFVIFWILSALIFYLKERYVLFKITALSPFLLILGFILIGFGFLIIFLALVVLGMIVLLLPLIAIATFIFALISKNREEFLFGKKIKVD